MSQTKMLNLWNFGLVITSHLRKVPCPTARKEPLPEWQSSPSPPSKKPYHVQFRFTGKMIRIPYHYDNDFRFPMKL